MSFQEEYNTKMYIVVKIYFLETEKRCVWYGGATDFKIMMNGAKDVKAENRCIKLHVALYSTTIS
jgi:hypothetical protein